MHLVFCEPHWVSRYILSLILAEKVLKFAKCACVNSIKNVHFPIRDIEKKNIQTVLRLKYKIIAKILTSIKVRKFANKVEPKISANKFLIGVSF